jgi:predicted nucleic acid-binding protein
MEMTKGADLFVDASYVIALAISADELHGEAVEWADWLRSNPTGLVTTRAVLLEIGNALARLRFRTAGVAVLETMEADPRVQVVPLSDELWSEAFSLFRSRKDKGWGMTDCISFVVMHRLGISGALTADHHFEQAGFQALLRN